MLCFTSPTRKRFASAPSRLIASMILSWASLMSWYSSTKMWSNCRRHCCAAGVGPPVTQGCIKLLDFSLSSIGWRRGLGRGGAFLLVSPLLGPLPTRSSRGEDGELGAAMESAWEKDGADLRLETCVGPLLLFLPREPGDEAVPD